MNVSSSSSSSSPATKKQSAAEVVRNFYRGLNAHNLNSVEEVIAEKCVYEDLLFPQPCVGRQAVLDFFKNFFNSTSTVLHFVIDDISGEDSVAVGVIWHLEWKGKTLPFSKGCSFYRLETVNKRQIIYGRDVVGSAIKPGKMALVFIRGVSWLLHKCPHLTNWL